MLHLARMSLMASKQSWASLKSSSPTAAHNWRTKRDRHELAFPFAALCHPATPLAMIELNCSADHACVTSARRWSIMAQREKLTEKLVRVAEPRAGIYQVFDEDVRGFSMRIFTSGSRHFTLDYRVKGRQRRADGRNGRSQPRANRPRRCAASMTMAVILWASGKPGWSPPASPI